MPEPEEQPVPVRRVSMTVTGYLRHGHPAAGWYDMQGQADGGETYSIPAFAAADISIDTKGV